MKKKYYLVNSQIELDILSTSFREHLFFSGGNTLEVKVQKFYMYIEYLLLATSFGY